MAEFIFTPRRMRAGMARGRWGVLCWPRGMRGAWAGTVHRVEWAGCGARPVC